MNQEEGASPPFFMPRAEHIDAGCNASLHIFLRVVGGLGGFFAWLRTALAGRKRMRVECSPKGRCRGRKDAAPTEGEHQPSYVVGA